MLLAGQSVVATGQTPAPTSNATQKPAAASPAPAIKTAPANPPLYDPTKVVATEGAIPAPPDPAQLAAAARAEALKKVADSAARAADKSFLWSVKDPIKGNTIFLFGTIHVGKRSFYPLPATVEAALAAASRLAVEADISNHAAADEVAKFIAADPKYKLEQNVSKELFERLKAQLLRLKIPVPMVQPMKPYLLGGLLSIADFSRLGYDISAGVDAYLINAAKIQKKPVVELESQIAQIKLLDGMSSELQEAFLDNVVSTLESGKGTDQVTGMVNAWQSGDSQLMQDVVNDVNRSFRFSTTFDEVMLYSRHPAMVEKISGYLDSGEIHFVAVGSLHLIGERGLIKLLRGKGLQVEQL